MGVKISMLLRPRSRNRCPMPPDPDAAVPKARPLCGHCRRAAAGWLAWHTCCPAAAAPPPPLRPAAAHPLALLMVIVSSSREQSCTICCPFSCWSCACRCCRWRCCTHQHSRIVAGALTHARPSRRTNLLNLHIDKPFINNCMMVFGTLASQPVRACALLTCLRAVRAAAAAAHTPVGTPTSP